MPTIQRRNDSMVNLLRADFQHRYEPNFAWVNSVSAGLLLPQLRGCWPTSSVDNARSCYDVSGQGRTITPSPIAGIGYGIYNLLPYADFTRASSQYLSRADEAGLSSSGGMTIGGWFYFDAPGMGVVTALMAKWVSVQTDNREYRLWKDAANMPNFSVSANGIAFTTITGTTALLPDTWYFIIGRLVSGATLDLFVNDVAADRATLTTYTTPTAITNPFNSTANFNVGADENGAANFLDGRATLMHLGCAAAAAYPVATDTLIWSLFEQTRAGFNC